MKKEILSYQLFSLFCLIYSQTFTASAYTSQSHVQQGDTLIQRGLESLKRNKPQTALKLFNDAHSIYKKASHPPGFYRASINKSVALKKMGQYYRACTTLTKVLTLDYEYCQSQSGRQLNQSLLEIEINNKLDTTQQLAALHNLGNNLQILGQLESSAIVLKHASSLKPSNHDIHLSLANTYHAQYKRAISQRTLTRDTLTEAQLGLDAKLHAQSAIKLYSNLASSPTHRIHAQLNSLQLLLSLDDSDAFDVVQLHKDSQPLIHPLVKNLLSNDFSQFPEDEAINLQLKLSQLLSKVDRKPITPKISNSLLAEAFNHAQSALVKANTLNDPRLKSQAYGTLGRLYLQSKQQEDAMQVFKQALNLAQANTDDSLAYQWSWHIAQIHEQQKNRTQALTAYDTSIQHLERVRTKLISATSDLQFSYQESVEPVYTEYLQLLLDSPSPDLELVLSTHQQLQVAELENYLKCGRLNVTDVNQPQQSDSATRIHIFQLEDKVDIIVQNSEGLYRHQPNSDIVMEEVFNLVVMLDNDNTYLIPESRIKKSSQALYQQILGPIKQYLPTSGLLIFHLDSHFQNLPMGLLHDGQTYLIEKYSVQTALSVQLRQAQTKDLSQMNVLFAGLSDSAPSFNQPNVPRNLNPLPEVEAELEGVAKASNLESSLLNHEFTTDRLETALRQDTEVVHIATHGLFSSDLSKTMLLAYNQPINALEFHNMLNRKRHNSHASLELLILSACQTAKGDKKSALGLAGIATQAGSRNTLASLWLADSSATTELISVFYQELKDNSSKAKALQQAQLKLIRSEDYSHPFFWGNFILVGN